MLKIDFDQSALLKKIDDWSDRFSNTATDMENELMSWQLDDMNRNMPNVERESQQTVATKIFARGRRAIRRFGLRPRGRPRGSRARAVVIRPEREARPITMTSRPILRPELMDILTDRMRILIQSAMKWR